MLNSTPNLNHTHPAAWEPYEQGSTIGERGNEGGRIIRDEIYPAGASEARITLEQDCLRAPHAITAVIYEWIMHTRFIADEPTALSEYGKMQKALAAIADQFGEDGLPTDTNQMDTAINAFIEAYP
ncbi:MAG: hypothetical protein U0670_02960 [Anaerolineae bacterium]